MEGAANSPEAMDIGVSSEPVAPPRARRSRRSGARRSLPVWAIAALALAVGWLLGTLTNQPSAEPEPEPEVAAAVVDDGANETSEYRRSTSEDPLSSFQESDRIEGPVEAAYEVRGPLISPRPLDAVTITMAQAPLRGVAVPADIRVIDDGVTTPIALDRQLAGATEGGFGQSGRRMLTAADHVVFMALDAVMIFDPFAKTEPVEVATAIYLLPGSEPSHVWAVTSGSKTVLDIDVRTQTVVAEYDLTNVGTPVGSVSGGVVVAPAGRGMPNLAIWSPTQGLSPLWLINESISFVGAAGNLAVVNTPDGLASYNLVTGELAQSNVLVEADAQRRALVSPDGSHVAIATLGSVTELPRVQVIDIARGEIADVFDAAFLWQLHWVSDTELLYMLPSETDALVLVRYTNGRMSSVAAELTSPNFWVTVARET